LQTSGATAEDGGDLLIRVTRSLAIDEREVVISFVRSSGPGGQNVNKVASAAQLRFDIRHSRSLPEGVRGRLLRLAGRRVTSRGVLIIDARRYRSQERNRQDALERLMVMVRKAAEPTLARQPTDPTAASRERRLESKRRQSTIKRMRQARRTPDD
jgi:ribosome-associated protein